jgi:hypothetical protein
MGNIDDAVKTVELTASRHAGAGVDADNPELFNATTTRLDRIAFAGAEAC